MSRRHHGDIYDLIQLQANIELAQSIPDEQRDRILRVVGFGALYVTGVIQFVGVFKSGYAPSTRVISAVWAGIALWVYLARRGGAATRARRAVSDGERVWVKSWRPDGRRTPSMIMTRGEARERGFEVDEPYDAVTGGTRNRPSVPASATTAPAARRAPRPAVPPECGCPVPHHHPHQHVV